MEISETAACPFCGQFNEITLDSRLQRQRFTTDCEVCCRPFEVVAECEGGEILNLETIAN
jgi:transposase-like protein